MAEKESAETAPSPRSRWGGGASWLDATPALHAARSSSHLTEAAMPGLSRMGLRLPVRGIRDSSARSTREQRGGFLPPVRILHLPRAASREVVAAARHAEARSQAS